MADEYGIALKITADASDAEAKLKRLAEEAAAAPAPVTVPVETGKAPPVTPPKPPKPVKVPVETEKPAPVEPPKDVVAWIRSKFDGTGVGQAVAALRGVRNLVNGVMGALGLFGLAANGVMMVVNVFRSLQTWVNKAKEEVKALREELAAKSFAAGVEQAEKAYERLAKKIEAAAEAERRRNKIASERKATARGIEDAKTDQREQRELAKLDPLADDYAEQQAKIRRKYEVERARTAEARAKEDAKTAGGELYAAAKRKDEEARGWRAQMQGQAGRNVETARERYYAAQGEVNRARRDGDKDAEAAAKDKQKRLEAEWDAAIAAYKRIKEKAERAEAEAASLRAEAGEKAGAGREAAIRAQTTRERVEAEDRQADARLEAKRAEKQKREAAEKAEDADWRNRLQKADTDAEWNRSFEGMGRAEKIEALEKREDEATRRREEAQRRHDAEMAKEPDQRDDREIARARRDVEDAQREQIDARDRRAELESAGASSGLRASGPAENRLTAMGLGAGATEAANRTESHLVQIERLLARNNDITRNQRFTTTFEA